MDATFLAELEQFEDKVAEVVSSYQAQISTMAGNMRTELAAVLKERQTLCDKIENFWPDRFVDEDGPIKKYLGATDQRIVRSITNFSVQTEVNAAGITRKFLISMKPNIALASTELFLEVNQSLEITATSGIQWKAGTEKNQKDSFFRIFDKSFKPTDPQSDDFMLLEDIVVAFEELYQDPFNDDVDSQQDEEDFDSEADEEDYDSEEGSEAN